MFSSDCENENRVWPRLGTSRTFEKTMRRNFLPSFLRMNSTNPTPAALTIVASNMDEDTGRFVVLEPLAPRSHMQSGPVSAFQRSDAVVMDVEDNELAHLADSERSSVSSQAMLTLSLRRLPLKIFSGGFPFAFSIFQQSLVPCDPLQTTSVVSDAQNPSMTVRVESWAGHKIQTTCFISRNAPPRRSVHRPN